MHGRYGDAPTKPPLNRHISNENHDCNANPNMYTYGWRPPAPPDPNARSFIGFDPAYEQTMIDQYVASHPLEVQRFRVQNDL